MNVTMKGYFEAFRHRLPVVMQTEATECGLACVAMIAGYYGLNMDLQALRKYYQVSLKGMNLRDIIVLADRLSLASRPIRADLDSLSQVKTPCILHWSFNHFVVLKKFSRRGVIIHDPAKGERRISVDELSKKFTGIALELWPNKDFQKRTEKKTIRLLDMFKNVSGLSRALVQVLALSFCIEIEEMPMKYETMVGDMGSALSGGQRQRISLARALYKRPKILFLDEATSDLDIDNEAKINDSIRELKITRVFVAHRPTMIAMADRVFDLSMNAEVENPHVFFSK
ncbi:MULTISPECIES: cysteine peptidase family C39 domain-containing protein [Photorhabdus]|uniref:Microcin l transport protein n=2 Tax=Photorhabdus asymbiotica TaxID=291112 RepID=C7BLG9_PHOAA|nr:cysteine peptidase family C39 domain-containing protein [Photorhabdus asymbiotica]RKS57224.1 ABC transporter family protein [Photorhabdus asymbiotica]CAQ84416.1 putative microcin l transport protein [Photorhabdus asymbiotica]